MTPQSKIPNQKKKKTVSVFSNEYKETMTLSMQEGSWGIWKTANSYSTIMLLYLGLPTLPEDSHKKSTCSHLRQDFQRLHSPVSWIKLGFRSSQPLAQIASRVSIQVSLNNISLSTFPASQPFPASLCNSHSMLFYVVWADKECGQRNLIKNPIPCRSY